MSNGLTDAAISRKGKCGRETAPLTHLVLERFQYGKRAKMQKKTPFNTKDIVIHEKDLKKWQGIVDTLTEVTKLPSASIMRVDFPYLEVLRSSRGKNNPLKAGDRALLTGLYCERVIKERKKLRVVNALKDKIWKNSPGVKLGLISYLGFPLIWPNGDVFGTICVFDTKENRYNKTIERLMLQFKGLIETHLGLVYQNKSLELINDELKRSEEKIRVLIKEVHHRVKNNMQVVSSILALQSAITKDEKVADVFSQCQDRINSMALVHEKLYRTKDFSRIDLKEYIETLAKAIFNSYRKEAKKIALKVEVKNIFLDIDTAIPLGLIVNELVSNSLKYAFNGKKEGQISVSLSKVKGDNLALRVKDNGVGLPENFDFKSTDSFGFQLVTILAENELKSKIKVNINGGTDFQIIFKRADLKTETN
jgi:two-component sensor histidine kinase